MKDLKKLGKVLNKKEQRSIQGGDPTQCQMDWVACYAGCDSSLPGWAGLVQVSGCMQLCNFDKTVCETVKSIQDSLEP